MNQYKITLTRTESVIVNARTEEEAFDKILSLTTDEINECASLTGWESSNIRLIE